jgi:flavin-dependent dehydrogenase
VIVFGDTRQPSYAWSFDRGDGLANVGYGEVLHGGVQAPPTRRLLLDQLERLLPGATEAGTAWRGHHLPLTPWRLRARPGPVLVAGDAARLVNPLTGEGIYYAVLTGLLAGTAAATAVTDHRPEEAGRRYAASLAPHFDRHLLSTGLAARLTTADPVLDAGLRAAASDQRVFDDLVELGLAGGRLTPRLLTSLARNALGTAVRRDGTAPRATVAGMHRTPQGKDHE